MKICTDCGSEYNGEGICPNCGLIDDEYTELVDDNVYPYDEEKTTHYGDPKSITISDIAVMTKINRGETFNSDLKRSIDWDTRYGWSIAKIEIVNAEIKRICSELGLKSDFRDTVILFFKVYTENFPLAGKKLENVAAAIIYLLIRYYNLPYTLYDFQNLDFKVSIIYRYYSQIIRKLDLYKEIKPQDQRVYIVKFINELIPDKYETFREKFELIRFINNMFPQFLRLDKKDDLFLSVELGMIGAWIYVATKQSNIFHFTQKQISEVCGISEVTLREYIEKLKRSLQ